MHQFLFYNEFIIHLYIFWYFADRASQYIYLNINQLDALNFTMSLFHASTCRAGQSQLKIKILGTETVR